MLARARGWSDSEFREFVLVNRGREKVTTRFPNMEARRLPHGDCVKQPRASEGQISEHPPRPSLRFTVPFQEGSDLHGTFPSLGACLSRTLS